MKKLVVPAVLGLAVAVAAAMAVLRPVPHGHRYDLALQLTMGLALIWALTRIPLRLVFGTGLLAAVFVAGIGLGAFNLASVDPGSEIVGAYRSVFETLDSGRNPYTSGTIFHRAEDGTPVYGNFNYPPAEIYPYYLAYRILGRWDSTVLTGVMVLLNGLACVLLLLTFPGAPAAGLAAFFPLFLFGEIRTNPALTFLVMAGALALIVRQRRRPGRAGPLLIAVLFGLGLMTKFLILPLMAAYYWNQFRPRRPASLRPILSGAALALGTATLIMAPFGIGAVLRNTFLFNLVLKNRAALTTFYPNVLSGPLSALGWGAVYPLAAAATVAAAVLIAPRLRLFPALLTAAFAFLLAAPTPEPQYLPMVLFLALAFRCAEREERAGGSGDSRARLGYNAGA
jgi:hypothetical protein